MKENAFLSSFFRLLAEKMKIDAGKELFMERMVLLAEHVGGQAELSRRTGISTVSISAYTTGKTDPSRERLVAMSQAAKVSAGWLAAGEGEMQPGRGESVSQLEDPFIMEIKLWLRDLVGEDPDYMPWFRMEFVSNFERFKEWREKKRATDPLEDTGTG